MEGPANVTGHYDSETRSYVIYLLPQIWKISQSPLRHQIKDVTVLSLEYHIEDKKLPLVLTSVLPFPSHSRLSRTDHVLEHW